MDTPEKQLRRVRNALLNDMDNIVLKSVATDTLLPQDIKDYMQTLRDLPETIVLVTNDDGSLDWDNINLPVKPTGEEP